MAERSSDPLNKPRYRDPDPYRDIPLLLAQLAHAITTVTPITLTALTNLHREANTHDSLPTTASGRDQGPHGNAELTRVEAAAHRRLTGPTLTVWELFDYVITARDAANHAIRIATANLVTDPLTDTEKRRMYCIGDDTPAGAQCRDLATTDGRCDRHHLTVTTRQRLEQRARWANERRQRRHADIHRR